MQNTTLNSLSDSASNSYIITSSSRVGVSASCRESSNLRIKLSQNIYKKSNVFEGNKIWSILFFDVIKTNDGLPLCTTEPLHQIHLFSHF